MSGKNNQFLEEVNSTRIEKLLLFLDDQTTELFETTGETCLSDKALEKCLADPKLRKNIKGMLHALTEFVHPHFESLYVKHNSSYVRDLQNLGKQAIIVSDSYEKGDDRTFNTEMDNLKKVIDILINRK